MRMLALYRAGRQVEALRVYDEHRRRLADEIGVEPARELRDLEAAMLRHDPSLFAAGLVAVGEPDPAPWPGGCPGCVRGNLPLALTSFVGRDDQLAASERALAANRLVTLTGRAAWARPAWRWSWAAASRNSSRAGCGWSTWPASGRPTVSRRRSPAPSRSTSATRPMW